MTYLAGGLTGTMLRVDLTNGEVLRVPTPREVFERFLRRLCKATLGTKVWRAEG